jgi:hypothetical protein
MVPPKQQNGRTTSVDPETIYSRLFKSQLITYWPIIAAVISFGVWTTNKIKDHESSIRQLETWKSEGHTQAANILRAEILRDVGVDARRQSDENGSRIESLRATLSATTSELSTFRALTEHKLGELASSQKKMLELLERK